MEIATNGIKEKHSCPLLDKTEKISLPFLSGEHDGQLQAWGAIFDGWGGGEKWGFSCTCLNIFISIDPISKKFQRVGDLIFKW